MFLFLIAGMPLFYLIINALYSVDRIRFRDFIMPFVYGALAFVPAAIIYWIFSKYVVLHNTFGSFYRYQFLHSLGYFLSVGLIIISLLFVFFSRSKKRNRTRELTGWFSGYFFCFSLGTFILRRSSYGWFEYFQLPMGMMISIFLASVFISRLLYTSGPLKYLWVSGLALLPFAISFMFMPGMYNYTWITTLILVIALIAAILFFLLEIHGRLGKVNEARG